MRCLRYLAVSMAALIVLATVEGVVVASSAAAPSSASVSAAKAWPGGRCPDVRVLFARGSGEAPKRSTDPTDYAAGNNWGMGSVGASFREKLDAVIAGSGLKVGYEGVVYDALPVPLADTSTWGDANAMTKYQGSVDRGAAAIKQRVDYHPGMTCLKERIPVILGGYSQGAWAVRRAINTMTPAQLQAVDAVVLFGDPVKRWQERIVRWRRLLQMGLPEGIAVTFLQTNDRDGLLPDSIQSRTSSYCIPGDIICGGWDASTFLHGRYGLEATKKAAQFVRPELPVSPAQLPTVAEAATTYPFLRGGSSDVWWSLGDGQYDPPDDCHNWRDFTALSGRWTSYETRNGDMPYFLGYQDPGVFVYKFRTADDARTAFARQQAFVSRCAGSHSEADMWMDWQISPEAVPQLGDGAVSYKEYTIQENALTDYSEQRTRSIAVLNGRLLIEVNVQAEHFMPSRDKMVALAKTTIAQ